MAGSLTSTQKLVATRTSPPEKTMAQPPPQPPPPPQQQQRPPETPCSDRPPPSYAQSVAASTASAPSVVRHDRTNAAIAEVHHPDGAVDSIADPIDLFASDYDKVKGRLLKIVPSPQKAAAKRDVPSSKPSPASAGVTSTKVAPSSPLRPDYILNKPLQVPNPH